MLQHPVIKKISSFFLHRRTVIAIPMAWMVLFFLVPFFFILKISLSEKIFARPPFLPIFDWSEGGFPTIILSIKNYLFLFSDAIYALAYIQSIKIAAIATFLTLLISWPCAWMVAHAPASRRNILLLMIVLPFWSSFLLRVYAWIGILNINGYLNNFLIWMGAIDQPLVILQTNFAIYLGITYSYLPFMLLPLYVTFVKMDKSLIEASADLGCKPWQTFLRIIIPLSRHGIIAGCLLVFVPAVGEFVIPALLGGSDSLMIGQILWSEFFKSRDWPVASAVSVALVLLLVVPIIWLRNLHMQPEGNI